MPFALPSDWIFGLLGGLMIGASAALLLLVNGRVLGASGLLGGLVERATDSLRENAAFVAALALVPGLAVLAVGRPEFTLKADLPVLALAGLLVGFGTRMANGCTSGHGVVGMARFSRRSIAATVVYLAVGFATFYLARHIWGVI